MRNLNENMQINHKVERLLEVLENKYGAKIEVGKENPFKVLIRTILSQRTRDENTAKASKRLFNQADTPTKILKLSTKKLQKLIKSSGMYRQKAKRIKEVSKILLEKYNGKVPKTREELLELPGVGAKTADVSLMYGHGIASVAVDVHCERLPKRIGIVDEKASREEVKEEIEDKVPKEKWYLVNRGLVLFGRSICKPRNPKCERCPLNDICEYYQESF